MQVKYEKQPVKYLKCLPLKMRERIYACVEEIKELKGDIKLLKGGNYSGMYRYKINHYRIIFKYDKKGNIIIIYTINTRTNIKY